MTGEAVRVLGDLLAAEYCSIGTPVNSLGAKKFRRAAARINYLSQDRPDLNVAARVLAMHMAKPMEGDEVLLKRVLRYLKGCARSVYEYPYVSDLGKLVLYADSGWGDCKSTRRSISGVSWPSCHRPLVKDTVSPRSEFWGGGVERFS